MKKPLTETPEEEPGDAKHREIAYYAGGSIEGDLTGSFLNILHTLLIISLGMSPLLLGFLLSIKTFWAGLCDPVVAHVSDHANTRWGRRHPFILFGSVARMLVLIAMIVFFPKNPEIIPNAVLAEQHQHQATADGESENQPPVTAKKNPRHRFPR